MIKIHITEHKSVGQIRPSVVSNLVRVFVDNDYHYGYFFDEEVLFNALSQEQQEQYLQGTDAKLLVNVELAQRIVNEGVTPLKYRPQLQDSN